MKPVAIMVEPIQGEGGVRIPSKEFLVGLRKLADAHNLLLIFDEVQTGCGRTGHWFAYQHFGVTPDIMTLAKALCGGIAGGAMLAKREIAPSLRPGTHAATFGGNPIAARAGIAAIEMIENENLLENAKQIGTIFKRRFQALQKECEIVKDVRVCGVMIGIELIDRRSHRSCVGERPDRGLLAKLHARNRHPPAASNEPHCRTGW